MDRGLPRGVESGRDDYEVLSSAAPDCFMNEFDLQKFQAAISRRTFLGKAAYGLGGIALASSLLNPKIARAAQLAEEAAANAGGNARWTGVVHPPHFPVRAKRIIHLYMAGGPSHLETFDNKPELKKIDGKPFPDSFTKGQQLAQLQGATLNARGPAVDFKKYGNSGQGIATLFPEIGSVADDICIVKSFDADRADQPRSGARVHEQRLDHQGPPEHGLVVAVRARLGERQSAGLHRIDVAGKDRPAADFGAPMVEWLSAQQIPGRAVSIQGSARSLCGKS